MSVGMCARCKNRKGCKYRQPGTWVVECDQFEEDPQSTPTDPAPDQPEPAEVPSDTRSA